IADAWSMATLVGELAEAYAEGRRGAERPWPAPALQYADFAVWQRATAADDRAAADRAYWRVRLAGAPPAPAFGAENRVFRGGMHAAELPPAVSAALRVLGRATGTTLFGIALAAWQLVLGRWRGTDDVVVLSPVANRDHPALADVIGFFVNVVALRTRWSGDPRVRDVVAAVSDGVREALRHQTLPFEQVL